MGDPAKWRWSLFREAPYDIEFTQGGASVRLKELLPGEYWVHTTVYSRNDIAEGHHICGSSQGPHIYVAVYDADFNPTPDECDAINIITLHEASHQIDDAENKALYERLSNRIKKTKLPYIEAELTKQLKTSQELGAWEHTIAALNKSRKRGVILFAGGARKLRQQIIDALGSQNMFLDIEIPLEEMTPVEFNPERFMELFD